MIAAIQFRPRTLRAFAIGLVALALAACSSDKADPPQPPDTPPPATAPLVTTNPANQTVNVGQTATFTVVASGTAPLSYQWRRGGTAISGAAGSSYTTPATIAGDSGATFDVVISNSAGNVTSATASLTVVTPALTLTITQQPANATVAAGAAASFTAAANCSGGTVTYQWQKLPAGGAFADVAGATNATYTTPATQAADNASQYRAVVTCGALTQTSTAALLTVTTPPTTGVVLSVLPVGIGTAGKIEQAAGIVREPSGSYLLLDSWGLRRVNASLTTVTTLVRRGFSVVEAVDGPAATARLLNPIGVTVDSTGNAYITDTGTFTIRKYATDGTVSTIAGSPGQSGTADGTGSTAQFGSLSGIAIGPDGDLYVAERTSARIRRVTTAGVVTTYAGSSTGFTDGAPLTAQFRSPLGVAVASNGDVYVADQSNNRVRRIVRSGSTAGSVETLAGNGTNTFANGVGTAAAIGFPERIAVAGNALYVSDSDGRVRGIDLTSKAVTTLAGSQIAFPRIGVNDGTGTVATFDNLSGGYAANPDGSLLVSDRRQLRTVSNVGVVRTIGILGSQAQNNNSPPDGRLDDQVDFQFASLQGTAVIGDGNGTAWVGDAYRWIRRVTLAGAVSQFSGLAAGECCLDGVGTDVQYGRIFSMARDSAGSLFIGDSFAVRKVQPDSTTSFIAGNYGAFGAVDGAATVARFNNPNGIAVDSAGNVFVSDANGAIRKVDTNGNVSTFAGVMGQAGTADGSASTARFTLLGRMTSGPGDVLYVCDGDRLREVATDGTVTTITVALGCSSPVFDSDGTLYFMQQGSFGAGLYRLNAGGSVQQLVGSFGSNNNLASTPQTLGIVYGMALLAPKTLIILAGTQVLKATLP
jgi:sugar lactone lactonase YvrE